MKQVYGMKGRELTRGGLTGTLDKGEFPNSNPCSDVWLNCQKSADAIVDRWIYTLVEGLNVRRFRKFEELERNTQTADNFI